jgi:hypothetical protein
MLEMHREKESCFRIYTATSTHWIEKYIANEHLTTESGQVEPANDGNDISDDISTHDLRINHSLLSSWPAEFIPEQISTNIPNLHNHTEREGYVANLETGPLRVRRLQIMRLHYLQVHFAQINGERVNYDLHLLNTLNLRSYEIRQRL